MSSFIRLLLSRLLCAVVCSAVLHAGTALAQGVGALITVSEPGARLVRGMQFYPLPEGLRLQAGDIVQTGPKTGLVRLEWPDGSFLNLGHDTQILISPQYIGETVPRPDNVYVLEGWVKFAARGNDVPPGTFASRDVDLAALRGVLVAYVDGAGSSIFMESGQAELNERKDNKVVSTVTASNGEFVLIGATSPPTGPATTAAHLIQNMPRAFRDTLPPLSARFTNARAAPRDGTPVSYDDVAGWLQAEWWLRRGLIDRWRGRLRDPAFRNAVVANMSAHKEWEQIVK